MKKILFVGLAVMSILASCKKQEITPNSETSGKTKKPLISGQEKIGNLTWGLGSDNRVYRWNPSGNNWAEPNPAARMIDVSVSQNNSGAVWAIGYDGRVYRWNATSNSWDEPNNTARLDQITACSATEAWGIVNLTTEIKIYKTFNGGATWSLMPRNGLPLNGYGFPTLISISGTTGNSVIGIGFDKQAYTFNYTTNQWSVIPNSYGIYFQSLSGGTATPCWAVEKTTNGSTGLVYQLQNGNWVAPNSAAYMRMVSTSVDGVVWALGYDWRVYRWNVGSNSWDEPNPAARLKKVSSGNQ